MPRGSDFSLELRIGCLRRRPDETHQDQRQLYRFEIKNWLPPPSTRRNTPRSKATISPQNQELVASAVDPEKHTKIKGNYIALKSRIGCLRRQPDETHQGQRQLYRFEIKNWLPPPST
jgi:hypothetical protein